MINDTGTSEVGNRRRLQHDGTQNCSGGIDGRPICEYIFVKRVDSSAKTRSYITRIACSG
jgi:hypothetical protein